MLIKTVKVSQKGQITLPKEMREALGSEVLRLVLRDRKVIIEPVEDLAGSLKEYAKPVDLTKAKEEAWTEAVREKFGSGRH
ncbi:AbrB/MazE/SpoVT family DNA-binding domain-containing protein [Thermosulfurimonas dismutans]|uniref:SpoVT-AbrB domain-containing protein n=1 Tax=Thermosulfurimonas dismutans TaxID=999894 RepID=A0A179D8T4_9BACT|nr:AbrB/MazE/SpoVT family DNA-binding domain-containing protein [Thermosulfurimonas dismutans]OAQ21852.1 hypothetical protein TDIS_0370 [Thermosulfurimonas dismutans]